MAPLVSLCQIVAVSSEESLQDAGADAGGLAAAVAFEIELRFEGLVDRLDDLSEWFEESGERPACLLRADGGADQRDATGVELGFERGGAVALVGHQHLTGPVVEKRGRA